MTSRMGAGYMVFFLALALALPAYAQSLIPSAPSSIVLKMNPRYPLPGETVNVSVQSSFINLAESTITWRIGDDIIQEGRGIQNINVTAGAIRTRTNISVQGQGDLAEASARARISPAKVDLIWESDSYTPPFYLGRALPSAGALLRFEALAHMKTADGRDIPAGEIRFTWRRNGAVILSASGLGKSSVTLPS